jgi:hypothetical protein
MILGTLYGSSLGADSQESIVSELKEAIGTVLPSDLEQNRNVFLVRKGRGLKILSNIGG